MYNYTRSSPKRAEQLKELNELLDQKNIKLKRIYDIRWLSMGDTVCATRKNNEALLMLTSSEGLLGDPTAIGLNQQLSSFLILALIHLSADVLSITNHLSKISQSRDVCFSALHQKFDDSVASLEALREKNGRLLSAMESELTKEPLGMFKGTRISYTAKRGQPEQKELFQRVRRQLLDQLLENLRSRFPKIALLAAMQVFEPASYPTDENQLVEWGNQYLALLQHYGMPKENDENVEYEAIIDLTACMGEFLPFKRLVFNNRGESRHDNATKQEKWHFYTPPELMKKVFGGNRLANQTILPVMFKLACLCLCVMVGKSEAERAFSRQNRIKTKSRTHLSIKQLDKLISPSYCGMPIGNFDYESARVVFCQNPHRI